MTGLRAFDPTRPLAYAPHMNPAMTHPPPLALYVHLPWCVRKCPYCDFNSHEPRGEAPFDAYVAALLRDLEGQLPDVWGRRLESIFIGGGTPSLFPPEALNELMSGLRARLPLRPDCEVTLEANPGTADRAYFRGYREAGVNRLSLGVQSFDDAMLARLGRIHGAAEARSAVEHARAAGFEAINLDLMFGLPDQSVTAGLADLRAAIEQDPGHISWYQLTLEPNTLFAARPPELPEDATIEELFARGQSDLAAAGYTRYEVSAYARAGQTCRHNRNYWTFGDYLGIGAGAHGKLTQVHEGRILRRIKLRQPEAYLAAPQQHKDQAVPPAERPFEFMLNALRLVEGVPAASFEARCGLPLPALEPALAKLRAEGLLVGDTERLQATERGLAFLNDVLERFLPEGTPQESIATPIAWPAGREESR
ncbi:MULTISPECIES: radical SAM family heme chaperone HemW [unclassified Thioalkalivibrio]|uniref:radical SAM family heme chaperone HemW n=1 Tax=unclassified Thioalkalivibrio TaxID=2621013 RepID=UPI000475B23B|nr:MULTISPECIES: radical SAM family heme chaperone HemW [unclassified Thioalkalivibrio]